MPAIILLLGILWAMEDIISNAVPCPLINRKTKYFLKIQFGRRKGSFLFLFYILLSVDGFADFCLILFLVPVPFYRFFYLFHVNSFYLFLVPFTFSLFLLPFHVPVTFFMFLEPFPCSFYLFHVNSFYLFLVPFTFSLFLLPFPCSFYLFMFMLPFSCSFYLFPVPFTFSMFLLPFPCSFYHFHVPFTIFLFLLPLFHVVPDTFSRSCYHFSFLLPFLVCYLFPFLARFSDNPAFGRHLSLLAVIFSVLVYTFINNLHFPVPVIPATFSPLSPFYSFSYLFPFLLSFPFLLAFSIIFAFPFLLPFSTPATFSRSSSFSRSI